MSSVARCPECELHFALSDFAPRDASVYERVVVPPFEQIARQSRCGPCNRVYQSRRRFVLTTLARRARELGLDVTHVAGSVYRKVLVRARRGRPGEQAVDALVELTRAFNDDLPADRCDTRRHGITIQEAPRRPPEPSQRQLFSVRARPS